MDSNEKRKEMMANISTEDMVENLGKTRSAKTASPVNKAAKEPQNDKEEVKILEELGNKLGYLSDKMFDKSMNLYLGLSNNRSKSKVREEEINNSANSYAESHGKLQSDRDDPGSFISWITSIIADMENTIELMNRVQETYEGITKEIMVLTEDADDLKQDLSDDFLAVRKKLIEISGASLLDNEKPDTEELRIGLLAELGYTIKAMKESREDFLIPARKDILEKLY